MDYENFETHFLSLLENNDPDCLSFLVKNKKLVENYLTNFEKKSFRVEKLNNKLSDIILRNGKKDYSLIDKVLKQPFLSDVLKKFKNSTILIKACQVANIESIKWLLTMNINPTVQDHNGMTALMYAVKNPKLLFAVDSLSPFDNKINEIADNNGETALFHSTANEKSFDILLRRQCNINHCNHDGDSLFIYCCKHDYYQAVWKLTLKPNLDVNYVNPEGKTALFNACEKGYTEVIRTILERNAGILDINYKNKNGDTFLSSYFNRYYNNYMNNTVDTSYTFLIKILLEKVCNPNEPIDNDGNTPIMYLLLNDDKATLHFLIHLDDVDLSVKNIYNVNASLVALMKLQESNEYMNRKILEDNRKVPSILKDFKNILFNNKTFDYEYMDKDHNNLLVYAILLNDDYSFNNILVHLTRLKNKDVIINSTNSKKENALIIAVKLGRTKFLYNIFLKNIDLDHQDELGNTALHYAVEMRDKYAVNILAYYKASKTIKNNNGETAFDLALKLEEDPSYAKILKSPIPPSDMQKKLNGSRDNKLFSIFRKSKNLDDKVDDYVKNYKATKNTEDYQYILENPDFLESQRRYALKPKFYDTVERAIYLSLFRNEEY
ncbi:hypothetical protein PIROE2DRAFT_7109 [Piromyces sp. E2]|nr:hypothetical protein PIROE2DRAFT_7109 [Piromyces sp. E2]|eukprot:OUM65787.1 hypothetical protein PIROE2DRAFT_7109 [Piromyces sp. E2]